MNANAGRPDMTSEFGAGRRGEVSRRRGRLALAAIGLVSALLAISAGSAAAAPAWELDSLTNTTAAPNDTIEYSLQVINVGTSVADASADPVTVTATLPVGLTASGAFDPNGTFAWSCSTTSSTVTCTNSTNTFPPGGLASILSIDVTVDPDASGTVTTTFGIVGGGAVAATSADPTRITGTPPGFGVDAFDGQITSNAAGDPYTQAGGHPYAATTAIDFNTVQNPNPLIGFAWPVEPTKDVVVDLPPGFVGNPTAADTCTSQQLAARPGDKPLCPPSSQVGTTVARVNGFGGFNNVGPVGVYNMVPPPGVPARFGFNVEGSVVTLDARLRSGSDYGLSVDVNDVPEGLPIAGTSLTFWGVPADPIHDPQRICPGQVGPWEGGPSCTTGTTQKAFLRNPTVCTALGVGLPTALHIDSWANPARRNADGSPDLTDLGWQSASFVSHLSPAYPFPPEDRGAQQGPTDCDKEPFDPTLVAKPATPARAGSPSGFTFDVNLPQSDDPNSIGEADLKKVDVLLPAGLRVSPSSADGLQGCSPGQVGLHSTADATCPDGSKLGSMTITTPLLSQPLSGSIFLATPHDNPSGSLIAVYLVAKGPGLIVKLSGSANPDPNTGQLHATFDDNPQVPFTKVHLAFDDGPRAPFVLPSTCGTYTTDAQLTSWSGKTVNSKSSFTVDSNSDGSPCSPPGFSPGFAAGTQNPVGGATSSFLLQLTRSDRDQELSGLSVYMPTGLLGFIKSATLCQDVSANAGSCGDASKLGGVTVGAGAGTNPFYITAGRAYITGPYKGAPYGLSIVVPAVAGPFDLGNVVVRAAIFVDKNSAQLKVISDPLPTILQGIPLDVRDVRVSIDRPRFIVNPTSCAEKHVAATVTSTQGTSANVSARFRATDCARLSLAPKISLSVGAKGRTKNGVSTPFSTTLTQSAGQSGLRSVSVTLPGTLNGLLPVINRACKLNDFEAGKCSSKVKVGTAVAVTPLLKDPLRGNAYFVKNPKRILPDLMIALRGQVSLDLTGKVSIPGGKRLATRFDTIPDAPITKFTLKLVAGKNGPVGVVSSLCTAKARAATAAVAFRGQNGKLVKVNQKVHVNGCTKATKAKKTARRR